MTNWANRLLSNSAAPSGNRRCRRWVFWETLTERGVSDLGQAVVREEYRTRLLSTLDELFAGGPRDRWIGILRGADIVSSPINTLLEASNDPDVLANGYIREMEYPEHDKTVKVHGSPWIFSETPAQIGVAPKLGAHTDELLKRVGYDEGEIQGFRERGVI